MKNQKIEAIYQLSPSQQGMLIETLFANQPGVHIEQFVCQLKGPLSCTAFEEAWRQVIQRHSSLRTGFVWKKQKNPLQFVLATVNPSVKVEDWSGLSSLAQQASLEKFLQEDRCRGFELNKVPLMRLALFQTAVDKHLFVWTCHHILLDGWCIPIVLQEVLTLYTAIDQGKSITLEQTRPYQEYIAWLNKQDLTQAESFWHNNLKGFGQPTTLGKITDLESVDSPNGHAPNGHSLNGHQQYGENKVYLSSTICTTLQSLVKQQRLTLNNLLQAVWGLLLARYSGSTDIVFGITTSGRPHDLAGVESMVGLFINTVPLRLQLNPEVTVIDWLREIQSQNFELRHYDYCSAGQIHQWSDLPKTEPLYESILVFENYPVDQSATTLQTKKLAVEFLHLPSTGAQTNYPLTILVTPGEELEIHIVYDKRRFLPATVNYIADHFLTILNAIADKPQQHIAELQNMIPPEQIPIVWPRATKYIQQRNFLPPRDEVERKLAQIWETLLDVYPVGLHDNFFDLGGHSLLAMGLLAQIQQQFDRELSLTTLLQHPTLEQMATVLRGETKPIAQSPVVAIQARGSEPPFFCVPGGGVNATYFYYLARHMGTSRPFYSLQPTGMGGVSKPHTKLEDIARYYIEAIQEIQPQGPYLLGGHSFGGKVAFEMARLLKEQGEQVALLAIIDTPAYIPHKDESADSTVVLAKFMKLIERFFGKSLDISQTELQNLDLDGQLSYLLARLKMVHLLPAEAGLSQARDFWEVLQAQEQVFIYSMPDKALPVPIVLFRAEEIHPEDDLLVDTPDDQSWGWNKFSDRPVDVFYVPGDHVSLLSEPNVQTLAQQLKRCLAATNKRPDPYKNRDGHEQIAALS